MKTIFEGFQKKGQNFPIFGSYFDNVRTKNEKLKRFVHQSIINLVEMEINVVCNINIYMMFIFYLILKKYSKMFHAAYLPNKRQLLHHNILRAMFSSLFF